eukprot:13087554-Alexandrium_andersonii.AAC.1
MAWPEACAEGWPRAGVPLRALALSEVAAAPPPEGVGARATRPSWLAIEFEVDRRWQPLPPGGSLVVAAAAGG